MPRPQGMQPRSGVGFGRAGDSLVNSEIFPVKEANKLQTFVFAPGKTDLPILDSLADRFTRYRINYVNISYCATDSTMNSGEINFGVAAGPVNAQIKDKATILMCRPNKSIATWKSTSVSVGKGIMPSAWLYTNDDSRDGVAFVLYILSDKKTGTFKVSYNVVFDYPNPQAASSLHLALRANSQSQEQWELLPQKLKEASLE